MKYAFFALLLLTMLPAQSRAAACYSNVEAEADQGIRIHSELMVIGLNCQHLGARFGEDFYGDYRRFTQTHGDLFARYEEIMLAFFKKHGVERPEASLNTLRTGYANKISMESAKMRPDVFCAEYAPRITATTQLDRSALRKWAATIYDSHPVSYPLCASAN